MNGEQLQLLNGFPLRLVVPGRYWNYWVKMLNNIVAPTRPLVMVRQVFLANELSSSRKCGAPVTEMRFSPP
jgi:DMSO/TMAO reductase YedYZ molybdopterin-dependent catalytic subunit